MKTSRIILGIVALIGIFMIPWWGSVAVVLVLLWYYSPYYEAVMFGVLLDSIYLVRFEYAPVFGFLFTFFFILCLFFVLYLRDRMRLLE